MASAAFFVTIKALTAFNRKNSGVNGITRKTAALRAFNRKNSGDNGNEPENSGVKGVFLSIKRR